MTTATKQDIDLRYWLANEDWYMSQYTRDWLKRTAPDEAAETLARIAEDAQAEPGDPLSRIATVFAASGFATSSGISGKGPGARKAGTRAALLLATRNDPRAIPPLVRVSDPYGFWKSKYQPEIEAGLTRVLTHTAGDAGVPYIKEVRQLVEDIVRVSKDRRDLEKSLADLLIAALGFLEASGNEADQRRIQQLADLPLTNPSTQPHRMRIQQAAQSQLLSKV